MSENNERFLLALARLDERVSEGFSVYQERSIHKAIKLYIEEDTRKHEVAYGGLVIDVLNEDGAHEVQTGSPLPIVDKLSSILEDMPLTLVLPYRAVTHHVWVDAETGEQMTPRSRAVRPKGQVAVARSLYAVRELIKNERFSIRVIGLEIDETRLTDGYGKDGKIRATLLSRMPVGILSDVTVSGGAGIRSLFLDALSPEFTADELMRRLGSRSRYDKLLVKLLLHLDIIEPVGKRGRAVLYREKN